MTGNGNASSVESWLLDGDGKGTEMSARLKARMAAGLRIPSNDRSAVLLLKNKAENGDVDAQCLLGLVFEHGLGERASYRKALRWYGMAADAGDGFARKAAGILCSYLIDNDESDETDYCELGAKYGNTDCILKLGLRFEGEGTEESLKRAVELYGAAISPWPSPPLCLSASIRIRPVC